MGLDTPGVTYMLLHGVLFFWSQAYGIRRVKTVLRDLKNYHNRKCRKNLIELKSYKLAFLYTEIGYIRAVFQ
jgi:hypothetical protein